MQKIKGRKRELRRGIIKRGGKRKRIGKKRGNTRRKAEGDDN